MDQGGGDAIALPPLEACLIDASRARSKDILVAGVKERGQIVAAPRCLPSRAAARPAWGLGGALGNQLDTGLALLIGQRHRRSGAALMRDLLDGAIDLPIRRSRSATTPYLWFPFLHGE